VDTDYECVILFSTIFILLYFGGQFDLLRKSENLEKNIDKQTSTFMVV